MGKADAGRYHRQKRELKESQYNEIRDSFDLFDTDGVGTIQSTDLVRARAVPSSLLGLAAATRRAGVRFPDALLNMPTHVISPLADCSPPGPWERAFQDGDQALPL